MSETTPMCWFIGVTLLFFGVWFAVEIHFVFFSLCIMGLILLFHPHFRVREIRNSEVSQT